MILNQRYCFLTTLLCCTSPGILLANKNVRNISIRGDSFMLDGHPHQILSGSIHYFRVPAPYWLDRLHKLKAAGLNSVSTYIEWSYHEPEERRYEFTGDRDVAHFIRLAAAEGLHVLLRPGPYICAERDLGGLPYWLLSKYGNIRLRSNSKEFMNETKIWFDKLFEQLSPLLYGNGGPIILVQVENEYSLYGSDHDYMIATRDLLWSYINKNAVLYTADPSPRENIINGAVPSTLTTINFGSDKSVPQIFSDLREYMPHGPLMNSEYYSGWLTHWGEKFQRFPSKKILRVLREMLDNSISFNIYMFHGGTNFGFSSGANYQDKYLPQITSYDYDAPLSEAGDPTLKYYDIRHTIEEYFPDVKKIPVPRPSPKTGYKTVTLKPKVYLLSSAGRKAFGKAYGEYSGTYLPTFEALRQRSGLMLYETYVHSNSTKMETRLLTIEKPRDRIYVFVDREIKGVISRMEEIYDLPIEINNKNTLLSLLVENQGRINFGPKLHDFKGILSPVRLSHDYTPYRDWSITGFPLENIVDVQKSPRKLKGYGPAIYEGLFTLPSHSKPLDTFLEPVGWGKGYIWVNGYNLGRYWPSVGPQFSLYVPGAWLHAAPATNTLRILELEAPSPSLNVYLVDHHTLDRNNTEYESPE